MVINKIVESNSEENLDLKLKWHCVQHSSANSCMGECYLQELLSLFGKKHTMRIIRLLLINEKLRFNELLNKLGGSPKTITTRLRELEKRGLLIRKQYNEIPIRVEYSLTEAGRGLEGIFETISRWIKDWMLFKNDKKVQ